VDVHHVLSADLEVAEGHPWKRHITLLGPVLVLDQTADDVDAEGVVLGRQDVVEEEQLTNHVDDVEKLRDDEQYRQVVAPSATGVYVVTYSARWQHRLKHGPILSQQTREMGLKIAY